jgi:4-aminobutyrate aminotransferase-like enzyme
VVKRAQELRTLLITAGEHDQVIRVIPPLVITQEQADAFLDVFSEALKAAE